MRAGDVAFVIEGLHGEKSHRIDVVFDCELLGEVTDAKRHMDENQTGCEWLPMNVLNTLPLYPSKLRRAIMQRTKTYLGNENVGDPEEK